MFKVVFVSLLDTSDKNCLVQLLPPTVYSELIFLKLFMDVLEFNKMRLSGASQAFSLIIEYTQARFQDCSAFLAAFCHSPRKCWT